MKKLLFLPFLLLTAALALSACSGGTGTASAPSQQPSTDPDTAPASTAPAQGAPDDVLKIRVGAQPTSGQVFQFIADKHGFNEEEGVEVEMVWLSNLSDAASALTAGQVDVLSTYGTGGPLTQIANGQDFNL